MDSGDETSDDDEEEDEDEDDEEEDSEGGGEGMGEEGDEDDDEAPSSITVDFAFFDPRPIDFKSVRRLLERLVVGEEGFPLSSLAEDVIAQRVVGTMVKVPGDGLDDAYAFATLLPMALHAHKDWARALKAYLLKKAGRDEAALAALAAAWAAPATLGLLLNERIFNMPPELAPAVHDSLLQDLAWAKVHAPGDCRVAFQDVTQVLVVAPCWLEAAGGAAAGSAAAGGGGSAGALGGGAVPPGYLAHYLRFEEALWAGEATARFAFAVAAPAEGGAAAGGGGGGGGGEAEAPSVGGAGAVGGGGGGGGRKARKRKGGQEGGEDMEEEAAPSAALHAPQVRHVMLVPIAALPRAAAAMASQVEAAKEAQRKQEAGSKKASK